MSWSILVVLVLAGATQMARATRKKARVRDPGMFPSNLKNPPPTFQKAEAAKRQLNSGRAKLEKQRTLERVRCFTTTSESAKVAAEKIPEGNGLEKEICLIMEAVLPWIKSHDAEIAAEERIIE